MLQKDPDSLMTPFPDEIRSGKIRQKKSQLLQKYVYNKINLKKKLINGFVL
jgi:hypothetical protein